MFGFWLVQFLGLYLHIGERCGYSAYSKTFSWFLWLIITVICVEYRSRHWKRLWELGHWLRTESVSEAAALLLRHPGFCAVGGHGPVLSYDGVLDPVCFLKPTQNQKAELFFLLTGIVTLNNRNLFSVRGDVCERSFNEDDDW